LAGADRFATAAAVTDELLARRRVGLGRVWAATGHDWADAVTAGPVVAGVGESLMLVDGADRGGDANAGRWLYARGLHIDAARALGGDAAVSPAASARLARRIS
ncbi:MAG TPA: cell wall-binding repeat-containing protein, partial [Egibacteraceae bacterium]|nr:cell wall-binding repeat-containing protein [Egibacteraceae bacterium]